MEEAPIAIGNVFVVALVVGDREESEGHSSRSSPEHINEISMRALLLFAAVAAASAAAGWVTVVVCDASCE